MLSQAITATLEISLQNAPLAIGLALGTGAMLAALPAMLYAAWMLPAALALAGLLRWSNWGQQPG